MAVYFIIAFLYFYSLVVHCDLSLGHTAAEHIHLSCFRVLNILTSTHCLVLNLQPWAQLCKCQYLCQFPIHKRRLSVNIRHYEALIKQAPILGIWTVCLANRRGMTLKSYKLIKAEKGLDEPKTTHEMVWRISWPFMLIYPWGHVSIRVSLEGMGEETVARSLWKASAMTSHFRIVG